MTIAIRARLGPYEITAKLGEGGMGEVYRATDSKLKREVAIKVLPEAFTADPERLARFEREAQLLAQLQHPHIASIFGLEESGGVRALVMELVPGPTLADRLAQGALPLEETLAIARQIAEALEAAHEKGIVHRDLKPQNVKVTVDGTVKVLDFGLAKALDPVPGSSAAADLARSPTRMNSPTLTAMHGTQLGVILGTAAYMAPEQAKGLSTDKRADIWAFGVVLYEMLSGARLFAGDSVAETLAGVLKTEIDWKGLPAETPVAIRQLLRRCLERNPKNRLHDIADARIVLQEVAAGSDDAPEPAPAGAPAKPARLPWIVAAVATAAAVALAVVLAGRSATAPGAPSARFELDWPDEASGSGVDDDYLAVSPDGRFLAVAAQGKLWVRPLASIETRPLAGTEGATYPFFSPDGSSVGYFAGGELRRIPRDGGASQKLCDAPDGRGAVWGRDGTILFSDRYGKQGLSRIGDRGGKPVALPRLELAGEKAEVEDRYPQFLPNGSRFLFLRLTGAPEAAGVYVGALDGAPPVRVLDGTDGALYTPDPARPGSGHLLFRRQGILTSVRFDLERLRAEGEPIPLGLKVGISGNTGHGGFAVSGNGVLVHCEFSGEREVLNWLDPEGRSLAALTDRLSLRGFELSPDGRTVAYGHGDFTVRRDIWLQPAAGGAPSRFTFGEGAGWATPVWSPDGAELAYATQDRAGEGHYEIRRRRLDRSAPEQTLLASDRQLFPWDWSTDGRQIIYTDDRDGELWLLPLAPDAKPTPFTSSPQPDENTSAQFSTDGRFLTYTTTIDGRRQVFVQTYPPSGALWQVTTAGGDMPRWRADGRELYYRTADGTLMAVAVAARSGAIEFGAPRALFAGVLSMGNTAGFTYLPAADGQRFLASRRDAASRSSIVVSLRWQESLAESAGR